MKVAILFDNFGPYHHARLAAASGACDLLAVEFGSRSGEYAWAALGSDKLQHQVVNTQGSGAAMPATAFREKLGRILSDFGPAVVVVPGWSNRGGFMAMTWARAHRVPIVLMSESTAWDEARAGWKEWIKRRVVGLSSAALVGGQPHADYMCQLGMPEQQVFLGYDAVDNDYFTAEAAKWRRPVVGDKESSLIESSTLNPQLSTPNHRPYFLASNRFIEKKNLFRLLEAYGRYRESEQSSVISDQERTDRIPWDMCLLGDGELKEKLLAHCETLGLNIAMGAPWEPLKTENLKLKTTGEGPSVFFPGFRQIEELPKFYAHAGAFVHASTTEQWGLVVNEAMASGLPVIVSNRVGCAQDLVQEGINGFTFDPFVVEQLAQLMLNVSIASFPLTTFGDASRKIIAHWGPARFATGLKAACEKAREVTPKKAGILDRILIETLIRIR